MSADTLAAGERPTLVRCPNCGNVVYRCQDGSIGRHWLPRREVPRRCPLGEVDSARRAQAHAGALAGNGRRIACPSCGQLRILRADGEIDSHPVPGDAPNRPRCRGNTPTVEHPWLHTLVAFQAFGRWDDALIDTLPEPVEDADAHRITDPRVISRLRVLYAVARTCNGNTPLAAPERVASLQLVGLIRRLRREGFTFPAIDAAIGCRPNTSRMRLKRHGAMSLPPSVKPYRGITTHPTVPVEAVP